MSTKEKVAELCKARDMNFYSLERAAGIGNGVIRRWDEKSPRMSSLMKVAKALEVPITELIADEDAG